MVLVVVTVLGKNLGKANGMLPSNETDQDGGSSPLVPPWILPEAAAAAATQQQQQIQKEEWEMRF